MARRFKNVYRNMISHSVELLMSSYLLLLYELLENLLQIFKLGTIFVTTEFSNSMLNTLKKLKFRELNKMFGLIPI